MGRWARGRLQRYFQAPYSGITRQGLTSAAGCRRILARTAGDGQGSEVFAVCGMDANRCIKVRLCRSQPDSDSVTLRDFAGIGGKHMQTNNAILIGLVADQLHVTRVVLAVRNCPLEGLEVHQVRLNIFLAVLLQRILLREPDAAVLERRKHSRRDLLIVGKRRLARIQAVSQQLSSLDGNRCQLGTAEQNIANRIYVAHIRPFCGVRGDLSRHGVDSHARPVETQLLRERIAPNCQNDSVVVVRLFLAVGAHPRRLDACLAVLVRNLLKLGRNGTPDELGLVVAHVLDDALGNVLIESTEEDRARHNGCVVAKGSEEACALEGDIRSTDDERLARRMIEREEIIAGDAALGVAGYAGVLRASSNSNDNACGGESACLSVAHCCNDRVGVGESAEAVDVLDLLVTECHAITPVEGSNVVLHALDHRIPAMGDLLLVDIPSIRLCILQVLAVECRSVHQLLGNASNIHARASKTPSCSNWRWSDKVEARDLLAMRRRLLGAREAARATADNDEVKLI
eukprot:Opistho-2@31436